MFGRFGVVGRRTTFNKRSSRPSSYKGGGAWFPYREWLKPRPIFGLFVLAYALKRLLSNDDENEKDEGHSPLLRVLGGPGMGQKHVQKHVVTYENYETRLGNYKLGKTKLPVAVGVTEGETSTKLSSSKPSKGRVFVIEFKGDMTASQVKDLREEVNAVLMNAEPEHDDEVIVLLTSAGGTITGYGLASAQLERIKQKGLYLTVAVDEVAASGGFMMAAVADSIVSAPFAVIGSIGVIMMAPNITGMLEKLGVEIDDVTAGEFKRTMVPYKRATAKERQKVESDVALAHDAFQKHVAKYRGDKLDVSKVATGETWFGEAALELRLIDKIATSDQLLMEKVKSGKEVLIVQHKLQGRRFFGQLESGGGQLSWAVNEIIPRVAAAFSALIRT